MEPEPLRPYKPGEFREALANVMKEYEDLTREVERDLRGIEEFIMENDKSYVRKQRPLTDKDREEFKTFMQKVIPQS